MSKDIQILGRSDFVGSKPRRFETYPLPWDDTKGFRVRSLTEPEASEFEAAQIRKRKGQVEVNTHALKTARRSYIALCAIGADDQPYLTEDDVAAMEGDSRLFNFAYKCCQDHNGVEEGEIEALVKNSPTTRGGSSPAESASPQASSTLSPGSTV